jgi:hypothetical protein
MGKIRHDWPDPQWILGMFSENLGIARRSYTAFVKKGIEHGKRPDLPGEV